MQLKVLDLINSNKDWERILSSPPYNLIIKWKEPFVLLKYNQLSSDMREEICQECRGIILKKTTDRFKVASMRFKKFFNYGEDKAAKVNSNTQLYKQAGNSIVVNVLEAIFDNLLQDYK